MDEEIDYDLFYKIDCMCGTILYYPKVKNLDGVVKWNCSCGNKGTQTFKIEEELIKQCPKCGSEELDSRGVGEYWYGVYEYYEWYCLKCGYSEEQYCYEQMEAKQNE